MQDHHGALVDRQAAQFTGQLVAIGDRCGKVGRSGEFKIGQHVQLDLISPTSPARRPIAGANGEAIQPGVPRIGVPKCADVAPSEHERFLGRVLGAVRVAKDEPGDAIHARERRSHQDGECVVVSRLRALDELSLHDTTGSTRHIRPRSPMYESPEGRNGSLEFVGAREGQLVGAFRLIPTAPRTAAIRSARTERLARFAAQGEGLALDPPIAMTFPRSVPTKTRPSMTEGVEGTPFTAKDQIATPLARSTA